MEMEGSLKHAAASHAAHQIIEFLQTKDIMKELFLDTRVEKPVYDGLSVRILEIAPQGVLCGSAALTITGSWMGPATGI